MANVYLVVNYDGSAREHNPAFYAPTRYHDKSSLLDAEALAFEAADEEHTGIPYGVIELPEEVYADKDNLYEVLNTTAPMSLFLGRRKYIRYGGA